MNGFLQSGLFGLPLNEAAARKQITTEQGQRKKEKTLGAKLARESAARMTGREADINVLSRYVVNPAALFNREQEQYAKIAEKIKKGGR